VDKFDSKQSQETIEHLLSSFKIIDSNNKDDPDGNNGDDNSKKTNLKVGNLCDDEKNTSSNYFIVRIAR
jgi:hypothetical protein